MKKRKSAPRRKPKTSPVVKTPVTEITPDQQIVGALLLGKVANYLSHLRVMTLVLEAPLAIGETIRIKGHTTDLTQRVERMQVNHQSVQSATPGEAVGLELADRVRPGDAVYKV